MPYLWLGYGQVLGSRIVDCFQGVVAWLGDNMLVCCCVINVNICVCVYVLTLKWFFWKLYMDDIIVHDVW